MTEKARSSDGIRVIDIATWCARHGNDVPGQHGRRRLKVEPASAMTRARGAVVCELGIRLVSLRIRNKRDVGIDLSMADGRGLLPVLDSAPERCVISDSSPTFSPSSSAPGSDRTLD